MSNLQQLIDSRGVLNSLTGYIIDTCFSNDGKYLAFAASEGDVWVVHYQQAHDLKVWKHFNVQGGGILSLSPGWAKDDFLVASDNNQIVRIKIDQSPEMILQNHFWVERIITWHNPEIDLYFIALSEKKKVNIYVNNVDKPNFILDHPYTISDIAVKKDKNLLVTSHYNGVTLWEVKRNSAVKVKELEWKGSHLSVRVHPNLQAIVTSMQDCELHGWRLPDYHHMRMSGYTIKVNSFDFSIEGKWLATSGTESVVLWPFYDGGPIGKTPKELPGIPGQQCCFVQFHPKISQLLVAGFLDGTILLYDLDEEKILPILLGNEKKIGTISCLTFNSEGTLLSFGTETGFVGILNLTK